MRARLLLSLIFVGLGCSSSDETTNATDDTGTPVDASTDGVSDSIADSIADSSSDAPVDTSTPPDAPPSSDIAAKYPGDLGIEKDPDVVFAENFEEGSVGNVTKRYDDFKNASGMALVPDVPKGSAGKASMKLTAGGGTSATDLYKKLASNYDELYVRYYAKYQAGIQWHHTGVWVGGYNPPIPYPSPQAGLKPNGDDRFSVSLEPIGASGAPNPRMDFYDYWMTMHSWKDVPTGTDAYYGNSMIHRASLVAKDDTWMCIELHIKLNPDPASKAGAELGLWVDEASIIQYSDKAPLGYWIKDKFCPTTADAKSCTDYPPPTGTTMIPLDLQFRKVSALQLNAFWPQNYITAGPAGSVWYDDMVIAKKKIGCIK